MIKDREMLRANLTRVTRVVTVSRVKMCSTSLRLLTQITLQQNSLRLYPFNKQVKAREEKENGNIFNYEAFPKSSVKYFTDALFGIMPKCDNIIQTIQLMNFLLFEGQATVG